MARQTVALGFGKANYTNVMASWACFKLATEWRHKVTAVTSGQNRGRTVIPAGRHSHHGDLISCNVEHEQGTILLFQARWNNAMSIPLREAGLFMRLRAGAPMYNLIAVVPTGAENICGDSFTVFSGMADVLTLEDLQDAGIEVPPSYADRYQSPDEITECFRLVQVAPETVKRAQKEAVATPTGVEMREVAAMPKRRILIGGRK